MFKQFLSGVEGLDHYLIFSMLVFIFFFVGVLWYVVRMKKDEATALSNIPLSETETQEP